MFYIDTANEVFDSCIQQNVNSEEPTNTCNQGTAAFLYSVNYM